MIKYPHYKYPPRDCLNTVSYRLLMVQLPTRSGRVVTKTAEDAPLSVEASYIHPVTRRVINNVIVTLQAGQTAYFVRSPKYAGWAYIVMWSNRVQKHLCTCRENSQQGWCQHIDDVPARVLSEIM